MKKLILLTVFLCVGQASATLVSSENDPKTEHVQLERNREEIGRTEVSVAVSYKSNKKKVCSFKATKVRYSDGSTEFILHNKFDPRGCSEFRHDFIPPGGKYWEDYN